MFVDANTRFHEIEFVAKPFANGQGVSKTNNFILSYTQKYHLHSFSIFCPTQHYVLLLFYLFFHGEKTAHGLFAYQKQTSL